MEPLQVAEEVVESSPNKLEDIYRLLAEGSFPSSFCSIKKKNLKRYARKFILEGQMILFLCLGAMPPRVDVLPITNRT